MKNIDSTKLSTKSVEELKSFPITDALFTKTRWAWVWLIARIYLGYEWLKEGLEKLEGPDWIGSNSGAEVTEFVTDAIQKTGGEHAEVLGFYARFLETVILPNAKMWGYFVVFGEILVGAALILGYFTWIAAFFGGFMNMNYLLSGSVAINPIMLVLGGLIILAWRTAGWWGADRWVLPAVGTPWQPGRIFQKGNKNNTEPQP